MQYAILHAATRVIRRLTTEPGTLPDEVAEAADGLSLPAGGAVWRLQANGTLVEATPEEAELARPDYDDRQKLRALRVATNAIINETQNNQIPALVKQWMVAFKAVARDWSGV